MDSFLLQQIQTSGAWQWAGRRKERWIRRANGEAHPNFKRLLLLFIQEKL